MVDQFNRGIYDYIIATDEVHSMGSSSSSGSGETRKGSRKRKRDKEYGVARGVDFQGEHIHKRVIYASSRTNHRLSYEELYKSLYLVLNHRMFMFISLSLSVFNRC